MVGSGILVVYTEIANAEELEVSGSGSVCQHALSFAAGENLEGVGVKIVKEVLVCTVGIGVGEEVIVKTDLAVNSSVAVYPVDSSALDLASVGGIAAAAVGIVLAEDFDNITLIVLYTACAGDEICTLQSALGTAGEQTLVLGNGSFHEIVCLNINGAGEGHFAVSGFGI